jgi:uncharacterized protein
MQAEPSATALAAHEQLIRGMMTALERQSTEASGRGPVERLQTHGASLLLTADRVYKIKKPVNLGFLDFSTLARRQHYCEEELRINRRYAPQLYRRVVAITGSPDQPQFDGEGAIIEYAVEMNRFAAEQRMDAVLARGEVSAADIAVLARHLSQLHAESPRCQPGTADIAQLNQPLLDNLADCERLLAGRPGLDAVASWSRRALGELQAVFERRLASGCVRECHGDLHLANLFRDDQGIHAFDAIEFDPALRWIDVMNDLAFLLMDLDQRGADDLSALLLSHYLEETGDYDGLAPLALFRCYRALVRAKVTWIRAEQAAPAERTALASEVDRYLALAERQIQPATPILWQMGGLSGSGKSTRALALVRAHAAIRIRSDVERKRLFGLSPQAHSQSPVGAGLYTPESGQLTYQRLATLARDCLRHGYSVVVDAASLRASERTLFRTLAEAGGWPWRLVWCTADEATLRARIEARRQAGGDPSEATGSVLDAQLRIVEPPDDTGTLANDADSAQPERQP